MGKKAKPIPAGRQWFKNPMLIGFGSAVAIVAVIGGAAFFLTQNSVSRSAAGNTVLGAQTERDDLVAKVGQLMELPGGEQPTVATVSDVSKLQGQKFFEHAKNGDKVLLYQNAKEAILYDPDANKIVQVSAIVAPENQARQAASSSAVPAASPVKVALYNGTTIPGLTKTVQEQLKQAAKNVTVTSRENASSSAYTKTLVIDLTGSHQADAEQLAGILKGTVGSLPAGEVKPEGADVLVILGKE